MRKFTILPTGVMRDHRLSKKELLVLIALYHCRNAKTGQCFPKRDYLTQCTGIREQDVSATTSSLQKKGWLVKEGKGGYSKASVYTMFWAEDDSTPETVRVSRTVDDLKQGVPQNPTTVRVSRTRKEHTNYSYIDIKTTTTPYTPFWVLEGVPF